MQRETGPPGVTGQPGAAGITFAEERLLQDEALEEITSDIYQIFTVHFSHIAVVFCAFCSLSPDNHPSFAQVLGWPDYYSL